MKRLPRVRIVVAFRAARSRLAKFMTGSFAVHGVVLAAVLIVPATRRSVTPIDDSMVVALVGPIAAAAAPSGASASAPKIQPTPPPKPEPKPKEVPKIREVPAPSPKPKEDLVKIKKDPPETAETGDAEAPETPEVPQGLPSASPQAGTGGAVTATVGGGDSSLGWYGAAVKAALEAAWIKPYIEDAGGTASVVLVFEIARDGTPRNIRIEISSGIQSLDRSAQRAAIEAAPFPGVPPNWTGETIPVTMRFDLSPESR